jgi:hypothetical protein
MNSDLKFNTDRYTTNITQLLVVDGNDDVQYLDTDITDSTQFDSDTQPVKNQIYSASADLTMTNGDVLVKDKQYIWNGTNFVIVGGEPDPTKQDVILANINTPTAGQVANGDSVPTAISKLQTQYDTLLNINAEAIIVGDGVTPAIPTANDANWKANKIYLFNVDNTLSIPIVDALGKSITDFKEGDTLQVVKTPTGYGYLYEESNPKPKVFKATINLTAGSNIVTHNLNLSDPEAVEVKLSNPTTGETIFARISNQTANSLTLTTPVSYSNCRIIIY